MRGSFRGCLTIMLGGVVAVAFVVLFLQAGLTGGLGNWILFLVCIPILVFIVYKLEKIIQKITRINMDNWLLTMEHCTYKYAYDGTGIAIDSKNEIINLVNGKIAISYPYTSIREWSYKIPGIESPPMRSATGYAGIDPIRTLHSSATKMSDGLRDVGQMVAAQEAAESKNGLYIRVKDIEHPEWFVKFQINPKEEQNLKRWMEILDQSINK